MLPRHCAVPSSTSVGYSKYTNRLESFDYIEISMYIPGTYYRTCFALGLTPWHPPPPRYFVLTLYAKPSMYRPWYQSDTSIIFCISFFFSVCVLSIPILIVSTSDIQQPPYEAMHWLFVADAARAIVCELSRVSHLSFPVGSPCRALKNTSPACVLLSRRLVVNNNLLSRGTIVHGAYGIHKNLFIQPFLLTIVGPINYGPP